jgi:hypothetical protein
MDDLAGQRHLLEARKLNPLDVPDDSDLHGERLFRAAG